MTSPWASVTINDEIVGLVYNDQGLVELLRRAGLYDAEHCLEDPHWNERTRSWYSGAGMFRNLMPA
ncbi:hypothetical protein OIE76_03450 [Streptomyces sp. NBC_01727]|nr:hypothetical protein OIE76_03450 [Streptomyces sp. NBC_01727]